MINKLDQLNDLYLLIKKLLVVNRILKIHFILNINIKKKNDLIKYNIKIGKIMKILKNIIF